MLRNEPRNEQGLFLLNWLMGSNLLSENALREVSTVTTVTTCASVEKESIGTNSIVRIVINSSLSPLSPPN
jgi:hypothetical protein